jgi:hypothetical protein
LILTFTERKVTVRLSSYAALLSDTKLKKVKKRSARGDAKDIGIPNEKTKEGRK